MTSHADTLRKHAAGYTGLRGYEDLAAAAIAGAEAIDTLAKVREVLDRLRQEHIRHETANNRGLYVTGYLDGIEIAHNWTNKTLGGTP